MNSLWIATSALCVVLCTGCSSTASTDPAETMDPVAPADPIFGVWRLGDETTYVRFQSCEKSSFCGVLVAFEGDANAKDELNADLFAWGRPLCGAPIVTRLEPEPEEGGLYKGRIYNPDEGETYHVQLLLTASDQIEARIYMGADAEELVDMAIAAALGDVPSVISSVSYATRAGLGKKYLSESEVWHRAEESIQTCQETMPDS